MAKNDVATNRIDAYNFIVRSVKSKVVLPKVDSDRALAKLMCRPEDLREKGISVEAEVDSLYKDIIALKEGKTNPTHRLIQGFRAYFDGMISEDEVKAYLVTPFQKYEATNTNI
jgi:hypothetical protein